MKKVISVVFLLMISLFVMSQQETKGDKKSNEILDRLTSVTEAYKTIKIEFAYKMENTDAGINESTDGTLILEGEKYRLDIAGQVVICDGETVWTYIEDAEEVQINTVDESEETITPGKLLTSYNKDYRSNFVKEDFMYGTTVNIVDLTPTEGKSYSKVRLIIDKVKDQLHEITIFDKNGSTYSYIIKKFEPNVDVKPSKFTFDKSEFPDVEVIDMR